VLIPSAPLSLLPNASSEDVTQTVLQNVYESLVDLDATLRLRPGLAESWYTQGGTWVFHLRPNVRWHDGSPLVAQEVVTAIEHARTDPDSELPAELASIHAIAAPDPSTVTIQALESFEALPMRLADVRIWKRTPKGLVGTGPYALGEVGKGEIALDAFPGYHGGPPKIPRALFRAVSEPSERLRHLEEGGAELVLDLPPSGAGNLAERVHVRSVPGMRVFLLVPSCRPTPDNPFKDVRVRRALSLSIDRAALVQSLGGQGEAVRGIATKGELGGLGAPPPPRDVAQAKSLLVDARYPEGFDVVLDTGLKYPGIDHLVHELSHELADVGIRVRPKFRDAEAFVGRIVRQENALYVIGWKSDTGDSRVSYEALLHSRAGAFGLYNGGAYSDATMDGLIEKASQASTTNGLEQIFAALDDRVQEDVPLIPLLRPYDLYGVAPGVDFTPRLDRRIRLFDAAWRPAP
jgi:peptide/nickel transport system substrate-binding protein